MNSMRFRLRTLLIGMTLMSVYFASYRALLQPSLTQTVRGPDEGHVLSDRRLPNYRFCKPVAAVVFRPLLWIDQRIRTQYWGKFLETGEFQAYSDPNCTWEPVVFEPDETHRQYIELKKLQSAQRTLPRP